MTAERNPPGRSRQETEESSLLSRPLELLTAAALRAPGWVVAGAVGVTLVALFVTLNGLEFKTSRLDLLNAKSAYNQRWLAYLDEFGDRDDAVVVVQSADPAVLRKVIDDLGEQLRGQPRLFQSVMDRTDLTALRGKALHYLPDEELQKIEQQTATARQLIPRDPRTADPGLQLAKLNDTLERVRAVSPEAQRQWQERYTAIATSLQMTLHPQQLAAPQSDLSPLQARFSSQYLLSENAQLGFVLCKLKIDPAEMARGKQAISTLREMIESTRQRHPQAWVGLTGMPVIEYDEMQSSQADMMWTGILSMAFVAVLFIAGYGGIRHAVLACIVLQLGMAWSFGFVTLAIGHLNILSSAFGVVVIGQGIDFSIHYVASYLNLRRAGHSTADALIATARDTGPGVFTGAISTAAAFFAAGFTEFTGIAELGIIGGAGILLCVCATAVVLPPLIYLVDQSRENLPVPVILPAARWVRPFTRHPALTVASTLVLTLVLVSGVAWMRYDHNLLNLQPAHLESSEIERELFSRLDDSVWFAVSVCDTKEDLLQRKAQFEKLSQVAKTEEIGSLLPKSSRRREAQISAIHSAVSDLPQRPFSVAIDVIRLQREVHRAQRLLGQDAAYETPLQQEFAILAQQLQAQPPEQLAAQLAMTSAAIGSQSLGSLRALRELSDPTPPAITDLPKQLTDRYVGQHGRYLIKVYAKGNIWDLAALRTFVEQVESVDAQVTGHPVQTFYASQHMQWSYIYSGGYALLAVFVLLLFDFRNLRHTLLAMLPLSLGFVQMCGLLGWLGIPFNPANMIGLPLIMGIGVDEGAHLVHEMRRQRGRFRLADSTTLAVILTSVTTMAGFGTLILSRHQGLRSMGQLLTLGVGLCLACTVMFLPALLVVLTKDRKADDEEELDDVEGSAESVAQRELPIADLAKENLDFRFQISESQQPTDELPGGPLIGANQRSAEPEVSDSKSEISNLKSEIPTPAANLQSAVGHLESEPMEIRSTPPTVEPRPPVPHIQYYRLDLPPEPAETVSLAALHREWLLKRQQEAPLLSPNPEPLPAPPLDAVPSEFSPLVFGPVTSVVPRRRLLPRRVSENDAAASENATGEPAADRVD